MNPIKSRQLMEAEQVMSEQPVPFNTPGYAYAVTNKEREYQALSVDGVMQLVKNFPLPGGEYFTDFGSLGGCDNTTEQVALERVKNTYK